MDIRRWLRQYTQKLMNTKSSPESTASGFALGTLVAILPTWGFSLILGLLLVLIFRRISKLAVLAALLIWNPLTLIPVYGLSYKIGDAMFGQAEVIKYNIVLLDQAFNFSRRFLIGLVILAVVISAASFLIIWLFAKFYHKRRLRAA